MTELKNNINHYMLLKGIKKYTDLLRCIGKELGIKNNELYEFARREKANFTKTLNGARPLKYAFIIPLEKIFGVSLARMLNENSYKLPVEKENVPFAKGFRYYAYLDDLDLYKNEFDKLSTKDGKSILNNMDEFGKTFLDYVVEYHAVNGVKYLHEEYGITLKWYYNNFDFKKERGSIWCNFDNAIEFARLTAEMNDADLFNDIYDSFNMFYTNGHYGGHDSIFYNPDYLEILMDNDIIFNSMFETRKYFEKLGSCGKRKHGTDALEHYSFNPILNNCLKHALEHLEKYKSQAIKILQFGIIHNNKFASNHDISACYICNELGGIRNFYNKDLYDCVIIANNHNVEDKEVKVLIDKLPQFRCCIPK